MLQSLNGHRRTVLDYITGGFPEHVPWRTVGIEDELLLVNHDGTMGSTADFFREWHKPTWSRIENDGEFLGYQHPNLGTVITDGGLGTLELTTTPSRTMHEVAFKKATILSSIIKTARRANMLIYGSGIQPLTEPARDRWQPRNRYDLIIRRYAPRVHLATLTASTQTHVAVSLSEVAPVTNVLNALSGVIIALAANSSIWLGREDEHGRTAVREEMWDGFCVENRVGLPWSPFDSIEDYANALLAAELFILPRPDGGHDFCDQPLFDIINDGGHDEETVRRALACQEGVMWFDARPRPRFGTIETRPACQQPRSTGVAINTFGLGIVQSWQSLMTLVNAYSWDFWKQLRFESIRDNLNAEVEGVKARDLAIRVFNEACAGLKERGRGEEDLLEPLYRRLVGTEPIPAETARSTFHAGGIPALLDTFCY